MLDGWVSYKKQKPDKDGRYLTVVKKTRTIFMQEILNYAEDLSKVDEYNFVFLDHEIDRSGWWKSDPTWKHVQVKNVISWMPLPDIPKEDE